jgi:hypothetical protein
MTGSYTMSPENASDVKPFGFNYSAPIYRWAIQVSAFYSKSDVN